MSGLGPQPSLLTDFLRATELAVDEVRNYLRGYADSTDEPVYEAVEVADRIDAILGLVEKIRRDLTAIERKIGPIPADVFGHASVHFHSGQSAIGQELARIARSGSS
jgi:hypothetical protein